MNERNAFVLHFLPPDNPVKTNPATTIQNAGQAIESNQWSASTWNPAANERREIWADYLNATSSCDSIGRLDCQYPKTQRALKQRLYVLQHEIFKTDVS